MNLERDKTRAFRLVAENPPLKPGTKDINSDPESLWKNFQEEGSILGSIGEEWYGVIPGSSSVPEDAPEAVQFMVAPRKKFFATLDNLGISGLAPGVSFVMEFLNNSRAIAGYNISHEDPKRRPQSQTWDNLHFHCLILPFDLETLPYIPLATREPAFTQITNLLRQVTQPPFEHPIRLLADQEVDQLPYYPRGGLVYALDPQISPEKVAEILINRDQDYRRAHRDVFQLFVKNYDNVRQAQWTQPLHLKTSEDIRNAITNSPITDKDCQEFLTRLTRKLKHEEGETDPNKKIFRGPAYSTALFKDMNDTIYFVFHPHFLRRAGSSEILGIEMIRQFKEGSSLHKRRQRANQIFQKTVIRTAI